MGTTQTIIYDSKPNPERHPDRLRVIAALKGLEAAPFSDCSMLDIGCGAGIDLIHHALNAPFSDFHGFDLSDEHLAIGQSLAKDLALSNVHFEQADIQNYFDKNKKFDYIFCHGVYSWVPRPLQEKILNICKDQLTPNGIAYISFNCLPGWYPRASVRVLLQQYDDSSLQPVERVEQARSTMQSVLERLKDSQTPHSQQLQVELEACINQSPAFVFHELLAETNSAFYLHDFVGHANRAGLQYLGDERPSRMRLLPGELEDQNLRAALNLSEQTATREEQIWDLLLPASIRGALLCHDSLHLARQPELSHIWNMNISSTVVPLSPEPRLNDSSVEVFCDAREYNLEIDSPSLKAALTALSKHWPATVSISDLVKESAELIGDTPLDSAPEEKPLLTALGEFFLMNLVDLYYEAPSIQSNAGAKPCVFPLAREQARLGFSWVGNPRFEYVPIDELDRQILPLLDGSRTPNECVTTLLERVAAGEIHFQLNDPEQPERSDEETLKAQLLHSLNFYLESALLVS